MKSFGKNQQLKEQDIKFKKALIHRFIPPDSDFLEIDWGKKTKFLRNKKFFVKQIRPQ